MPRSSRARAHAVVAFLPREVGLPDRAHNPCVVLRRRRPNRALGGTTCRIPGVWWHKARRLHRRRQGSANAIAAACESDGTLPERRAVQYESARGAGWPRSLVCLSRARLGLCASRLLLLLLGWREARVSHRRSQRSDGGGGGGGGIAGPRHDLLRERGGEAEQWGPPRPRGRTATSLATPRRSGQVH
ncbi:hypothetical protein PCL_11118 [Purpureocillium lilacinum]|uniref:Uncharacterized protein n=1 Tax=Purpureocillium lilacinum TaxID=33203 RepID=A0A2U3EDA0_PURLI|nr:hypothetical protein PCL_11118 [Purpureocillium lilacinum]